MKIYEIISENNDHLNEGFLTNIGRYIGSEALSAIKLAQALGFGFIFYKYYAAKWKITSQHYPADLEKQKLDAIFGELVLALASNAIFGGFLKLGGGIVKLFAGWIPGVNFVTTITSEAMIAGTLAYLATDEGRKAIAEIYASSQVFGTITNFVSDMMDEFIAKAKEFGKTAIDKAKKGELPSAQDFKNAIPTKTIDKVTEPLTKPVDMEKLGQQHNFSMRSSSDVPGSDYYTKGGGL